MQSSTHKVSSGSKLGKALTPEGRLVLQILMVEYQMNQDAALRLMKDGGQLFVLAVMTRRGR